MNLRAKAMSLFLLGLVRLLTGAQARWYGCPPKAEQRIYFANHQSHADLVLMWAALPQELRSITRPIAARDYWTTSKLKRFITTEVFNAVYVEREKKGDVDPLQPLIDALDSGDSLILFPEGTRGFAEDPQAFKSGLFNLAQRFPAVVLVPAWIHNVQRVMPKGEVVPVPVLCSVTFGAPIALA
jgi:1-acyl-sn-glycerol-3-phosphate acyltransferase